jgi:2-polyprenyl-3-methyl-5-hydroxy-6-metoxy-1,4-benzoquinol methylase
MTQYEFHFDADKILADNRTMHNQPGYAQFYDNNLGLMTNPWERKVFLDRLLAICKILACKYNPNPLRVLDLGAGTGNLTLPLLTAGYHVTALDMSAEMLNHLREKARKSGSNEKNLELICSPADDALRKMHLAHRTFHVVCACSFYHHLPDYLTTLELAGKLVEPEGNLFLAHEPMRKDTINRRSRLMQWLDFKLWRINIRGHHLIGREECVDAFYDPNSLADYWDLVGGCDQEKMVQTLRNIGFNVNLICYDSKRSRFMHYLCRGIGTKSLFMVSATRSSC